MTKIILFLTILVIVILSACNLNTTVKSLSGTDANCQSSGAYGDN